MLLCRLHSKSESVSHSVMSHSPTPWTVAHQALCPWNSPSKNTGVGSHSFLQGIFPIQELNRDLLHCWRILYQLRQGRPKRCIDSYFYLSTLLSHCIFNFKDCLILWGAISHKWNEIIWKSWKSYENTHVFFGIFLKWIILVFSITNGRSFQANSFNIGSSDHA